MGAIEKLLPYYTYEDYRRWEGQWELIDGFPFAMSPAPAPIHQRIASTINALFYNALDACSKCSVYQPIDFMIADDTILQPDLLVVCDDITKPYLDFNPWLVCEILSPATTLKDRHTKFNIYQKRKIPYFIIIAPAAEEAEIFVLKNDIYVLAHKGKDFLFDFTFDNCSATIDFSEIW